MFRLNEKNTTLYIGEGSETTVCRDFDDVDNCIRKSKVCRKDIPKAYSAAIALEMVHRPGLARLERLWPRVKNSGHLPGDVYGTLRREFFANKGLHAGADVSLVARNLLVKVVNDDLP